jgi:glycosyltransferase involved in cell wall biosynthesis
MKSGNEKNKIAILSSFKPKEAELQNKVGGLAKYMDSIISEITDSNFEIYSEKFVKSQEIYKDKNYKVIPTWDKSSTWGVFSSLKPIRKGKYSTLIINNDFGVFGGTKSAIVFPIFLILARLSVKRIIFIQHSGLFNLDEISQHLGVKKGSLKVKIFSLGVAVNIIMFNRFSYKVVLLEEEFKTRFSQLPFTKKNKFNVIEHPVYSVKESKKGLPQGLPEVDKKKFTILFFGFLTWYKGADWLVEQTLRSDWPEDVEVILAGGKTINLDNNEYYSELERLIHRSDPIKHTGFIPEEAIPYYFKNADLVILPYRVMMAASGPLAFAYGYEKPFMISTQLLPYTKSEDFKENIHNAKLSKNDFSFSFENDDFIRKIKIVKDSDPKLNMIHELSKLMNSSRSVKNISLKFKHVLDAGQQE